MAARGPFLNGRRARGSDRICRQCGYAGWAELAMVLECDFASVFDVLRKLHRR
jgi:hypothetical protein